MKVTLFGAANTVTGSASLLEANGSRVLVDCGMFMSEKTASNRDGLPTKLTSKWPECVLVTHAHFDHVGRLPVLRKSGYSGPVYATSATVELASLILRDAAKVQAQDTERINRKRMRSGKKLLEPLFTHEDVEETLPLFRDVPYDEPVEVAPGITARYVEAGHLLGSASIIVTAEENGKKRRLVFSGDLGPPGAPIIKDPAEICRADTVFMESTYGNRNHRPLADTIAEFRDIVSNAVRQRGKLLVPTFTVGRAQVLLYELALMFREKIVPEFPVILDSPMAVEATRIYARHPELFDEELTTLNSEKPLASDLVSFRATASAKESMELNNMKGPCLIMAGAGMCNAGRIVHHLKHNVWKKETSVLIVGYQAHGTLGRQLVDGRKTVRIHGERVAVKAKIHTLGGFSAHAGQNDLLNWFGHIAPAKPKLVLVHGEPEARETLAQLIREQHGIEPVLPKLGDTVEV